MSSAIKYRSDIDGLRAFAILSVLIFHLNPSWLYGGFIGVDVFFVISGYLITRIIIRENQQERFSFVNFYARRVKRIFPVLFFVLAVVAVIAVLSFPEVIYKTFVTTFQYASAQFSNFFFAKEIDYFAEGNDLQPLLHTWSLAVEEQFYLVWPFLIFLCYKLTKKPVRNSILSVFFAVMTLSFFMGYVLAYTAPKYAFYMFFTRAWEFCIGGIFALDLIPNIKNKRANNLTAVFGFVLMIASFIFIREGVDFVKGAVIVPVVGAGLIIYTAQQDETWISRMLSFKPVVYIGLISYSMYLWHWPVIVFYKQLFEVKELSYGISLILVVITVILSLISYYLIEQPARKMKLKNITALLLGGIFIGGFILSFSWLKDQAAAKWRTGSDFNEGEFVANNCLNLKEEDYQKLNLEKCSTGWNKEKPKILLIGDSHAGHYRDTVYEWANKYGETLRVITSFGCKVGIGYSKKEAFNGLVANIDIDICVDMNDFLTEHLSKYKDYEYIIIGARSENFLNIKDNDKEKQRRREVYENLLASSIEFIQKYQKKATIIFLAQTPTLKSDVKKCLTRPFLARKIGKNKCDIDFEKLVIGPHIHEVEKSIYENLVEKYGVKVFYPAPYSPKQAIYDGNLLYRDDDHLNSHGSRYFAPYFIEFMEKEFGDSLNKEEDTASNTEKEGG